MKNLLIFILISLSIVGCDSARLTENQIKSEKDKILSRIDSFLLSYENKDLNTLLLMLSESKDFYFLGSDVAEIISSKADFQNQMDKDWKLFESISFGEVRKLAIKISEFGDLATAIYEVPVTAVLNGTESKFFFRLTNIFENEDGMWQMVQGMASIPSIGESSAELNQRLKQNLGP